MTLYTRTYTNMHVNITEASTSIWPLAISAIGRPTNWLPQDYALEDANKHVLEYKEKASEVEKELIELLNLRIVQEGDYLYLTCASCLLAFTKLGGKLGQSLKDTEKGLRGIALEHLREHHLLKKKREDGKCEFEFIQDKQHGIIKTVFEGRIE